MLENGNINQMTIKELEIQGCKTFVCPNLSLIDEKGKELDLREGTIKKAKELAIEYFKKTYHNPRYAHAEVLFPAFLYLACIVEDDTKRQIDIAKTFSVSEPSISLWYKDITDTLGIKIIRHKDWRVLTVAEVDK